MSNERIDLGHGHSMSYVQWAPDRDLNPQYAHLPDIERWGATIYHPKGPKEVAAGYPDGECQGFVTFDGPVQREASPDQPKWTVEKTDPLTIAPSLLCMLCGDHGFIREGKWVPA